jgi:riboflavin kinase/FMN adenylyltransferase
LDIYRSISDFHPANRPVVTVGVYDGVHRGHWQILQKVVALAKETSCQSVVITFEPHPRLVLNHAGEVKLLQSPEEKIARFREAGIDALIIVPFDKDFAALPPADFIRGHLVEKLNISAIITGHDHFFGKSRTGDFAMLTECGIQYGFKVEQVDQISHCEGPVSSSAIRTALNEGNVKLAGCMLGYPYTLKGNVVGGNKIGKGIGFPTVNLQVQDPHKLIPALGVYASLVRWNANTYKGMTNIGLRPTIEANRLTIEANIFDFNTDIYHENISISLVDRIRDEQKFSSLDELVDQLALDKEVAIRMLKRF